VNPKKKFAIGKDESNYTVSQACRMCEFALASYCCGNLGHGVADWSCEACHLQPQMENITVFSSGVDLDANGFVAWDPIEEAIVIAFAGTDPLSLENWIEDIDVILVNYPACTSCQVDQGFYNAYQSVEDDIWNTLEKFWEVMGRNVNIQVVGHAEGGALATLCALDIFVKGAIEPQFVYTFGQPRVGNYEFYQYYASNIHQHFRVTHRKDPVPHIPAESFGYHHVPLEIFYPHDANGSYTVCNGSGEDPNCSDKYLVDLDVNDNLDYLDFDFIENYMSCKL